MSRKPIRRNRMGECPASPVECYPGSADPRADCPAAAFPAVGRVTREIPTWQATTCTRLEAWSVGSRGQWRAFSDNDLRQTVTVAVSVGEARAILARLQQGLPNVGGHGPIRVRSCQYVQLLTALNDEVLNRTASSARNSFSLVLRVQVVACHVGISRVTRPPTKNERNGGFLSAGP